ncbi:MAG: CAP domain-containing protein [Patescibacteria group bacterium]
MNNHRARVLHHKFLLSVITVLVFSSFFFSSNLNPFADKIKAFAEVSLKQLFDLTNEKRQENKLEPLVVNEELTKAAERKAGDMVSKDYWAHNAPDGTTPWVIIKEEGYDYVYAGENLARGFNSAQDVVSAWMASPDHRSNLLSPNFKDVGFAVINGKLGGEETFLVVQELGSKSVLPASVNIISSPKQEKMTGFSLSPALNGLTLSMSSEFIILFIVLIISVLIIDMVVVRRKKIVRFTGHSMDHLTFLLLILFVVIIFDMGIIL